MIIYDAERQQQAKLDVYAGSGTPQQGPAPSTTPLPGRRRHSIDSVTLPEYSPPPPGHPSWAPFPGKRRSIESRRWIWRWTLYFLAVNSSICLAFGIPYLIFKVMKGPHHVSMHIPPWESAELGHLVNVVDGFQFLSEDDLTGCLEAWDDRQGTLDGGITARAVRRYPMTGTVRIASNTSNIWKDPSEYGVFEVDINPDESESQVVLSVELATASDMVYQSTRVCFSDENEGAGVFVYAPSLESLSPGVVFSLKIRLLYPNVQRTALVNSLATDLPNFNQTFGDLDPRIVFDSLRLRGESSPIYCESIQAERISIKTSLEPIVGRFNVTFSLILDTISAPIYADIILAHIPDGPDVFSQVATGNGPINSTVTLLSPTPSSFYSHHHLPNFEFRAKNFNGEVNIAAHHHWSTPPVPLQLRVMNDMAPSSVSVDSKFLGTFDVRTKLSSAFVDKSGQERLQLGDQPRNFEWDEQDKERIRGWAGYGSRSKDLRPHHGGHISIASSMRPALLRMV